MQHSDVMLFSGKDSLLTFLPVGLRHQLAEESEEEAASSSAGEPMMASPSHQGVQSGFSSTCLPDTCPISIPNTHI